MAWAMASDSIDRTRARASMRASAIRSAASPAASSSMAARRRSNNSSPACIPALLVGLVARAEGTLQPVEPLSQLAVLAFQAVGSVAQHGIVLPPVDPHLTRAVD